MRPNTLADVWRAVGIASDADCWPYLGSLFRNGYGRFNICGTSVGAHTVVYALSYGEPQDGCFVLHKCNNKRCCNPNHLFESTNQINQIHASLSGAWAVGQTGIRGVGFNKTRGYWTSNAYENGRRRNLYTGPSHQKAISARALWEAANEKNLTKIAERRQK